MKICICNDFHQFSLRGEFILLKLYYNKMEEDDFFKKINFSKGWINLGIITPEVLEVLKRINQQEIEELKEEYIKDGTIEEYSWRFSRIDDEHHRWRAFTIFLDKNKKLPPETIKALYELGKNDPDVMMGGAMMQKLLWRADCPSELLEISLQSDRQFLAKDANKIIERRKERC